MKVPRALGAHAWIAFGLALLAAAPARAADPSVAAVKARLADYSRFVLRMDHHAIAQLYTPDGELGNAGSSPIHGPDAIEKYLKGFDAYHVLAYSIIAETTTVRGDSAHQSGWYRQRVRVPAGDTVQVHGRFHAEWVRGTDGRWLVRRMGTSP